MKKTTLLAMCILFFSSNLTLARILHVGTGQTYANLTSAMASVIPGDTIYMHNSVSHPGDLSFTGIHGTPSAWIHILRYANDSAIVDGGGDGWKFSDVSYVHISGILFRNQGGNGLNIDDGYSSSTYARHILIENCVFRDINPSGNNDLIKISGVDSFEIRTCRFYNGSDGGSGIDMVGCHNGNFFDNYFENPGQEGIQAKGGSQYLRIERNLFNGGAERALNLGGSTGLEYFRPIDAPFEAADIIACSNLIIDWSAPIAFVGCTRVTVVNNTLVRPARYVIRILQETVDASRFIPCGNNTFQNNLCYFTGLPYGVCNVGSNTDAASFTFRNNLWYDYQNASYAVSLPAAETGRVTGSNPLFTNASAGDYSIPQASPATGAGYAVADPVTDYSLTNFWTPRSIGAFEGNPLADAEEQVRVPGAQEISAYPNPFNPAVTISVRLPDKTHPQIFLYNSSGRLITDLTKQLVNGIVTWDASHQPSGVYFIKVVSGKNIIFSKKAILLK